MNKALSFLKTVLDKLIYLIRALAGAAAILAIIFGAFAFSDNEYKTGALQILVGALLFLFFSGNIRKPMYLLVMLVMMVVLVAAYYVDIYFVGKDGTTLLILLVALPLFTFLTVKKIDRHYKNGC